MAESRPAMQATRPPPLIIQPTSKHLYTFILLHGLGNNGDKFGHEFLESAMSSEGINIAAKIPGAKFIFPTAKWRRSSAFGRARLTQWFDILTLNDPSQRRELQMEGLAELAAYIRSIINEEMKLLPSKNIILGGMSQGCAMSLIVLLSLEFSLCAYIGMSCWLPFQHDINEIVSGGGAHEDLISFGEEDEAEEQDSPTQALSLVRDILSLDEQDEKPAMAKACLATPVFVGHGAKDEKIACRLGEEAVHTLSSLGMDVTWKRYPELGHWYQVPDEIDHILTFMEGNMEQV